MLGVVVLGGAVFLAWKNNGPGKPVAAAVMPTGKPSTHAPESSELADSTRDSTTEQLAIPAGQSAVTENDVTATPVDVSLPPRADADSPRQERTEIPTTSLASQLLLSQVRLTSAEAEHKIAEQEETIRELKRQQELATATRALKLLRLEREAYRHGEATRQRQDLLGEVELAQRRLKLAESRLVWSERLAEKGLVSQFGLETDLAAKTEADEKLRSAQQKLKEFDSSAHQRQLSILDRQVQLAETDVERIRRTEKVQKAKRRVNLAMRETTRQLARKRLARLEEKQDTLTRPNSPRTVTNDASQHRHPVHAAITQSLPIESIVAHGTSVRAGDVIVRFDVTGLEDELRKTEADAEQAAIEMERAREDLALVTSENELDISQSALAVKAAKLALVEYTEGEFPRQKQDIVETIDEMQGKVDAADRRLKWSERVIKKGYVTAMQLNEDQLKLAEQRHALAQLQHQLRILEQHTYVRELASLESQVEQSEADDKRTAAMAASLLETANTKLQAAEKTHRLHAAEAERLTKMIKHASIFAKADGRVLHDSPLSASTAYEAPTVGSIVHPDQVLATLQTESE